MFRWFIDSCTHYGIRILLLLLITITILRIDDSIISNSVTAVTRTTTTANPGKQEKKNGGCNSDACECFDGSLVRAHNHGIRIRIRLILIIITILRIDSIISGIVGIGCCRNVYCTNKTTTFITTTGIEYYVPIYSWHFIAQ
mmetsp:Transcript_42986/g.47835  ORF Transcript_42986/g.47835 Transcript_42986/m.47835 type:complete len:142 (-) Transcript_42986:463-888(-)